MEMKRIWSTGGREDRVWHEEMVDNLERVSVSECYNSEMVYISGNLVDGKPTAVYGPHKVHDAKKSVLENRRGRKFYERDKVFRKIQNETYSELKKRQQAELNAMPIQFAFNNEQFGKGMKALGLEVNEAHKVVSVPGGGFMLKTESRKLMDLFIRHKKEFTAYNESDSFMYQAFNYELANHEYCITGDPSDALSALSLTMEEVRNNPVMDKAFKLAKQRQR